MRNRKLSASAGFTLVELLIVVAIIGVLATIGVPQYRKMVEKAKSKEAQVALAGLYTAETAFFSEYGAYGNNLPGLGFELEGSGQIYTVGFTSGACGYANAQIQPTVAPYIGTIGSSSPNYYGAGFNQAAPAAQAMAGVATSVLGRGVTRAANGQFGLPAATTCLDVTAGVQPGQMGYFVASATGCIASGCTLAAAAGAVGIDAATATNLGFITSVPAAAGIVKQDSWAINQRRQLVRVNNGGS